MNASGEPMDGKERELPNGAQRAAAANNEPGVASEVIPAAEKAGDRIGRYKLLQLLGEGGMGSVWMAEQEEPVRRRVALKVIKLGMDTQQVIARFEAERQALALMDHPNIAKVLDAGATDNGRPFFVMELVKGIPITRYCDDEKVATAERLQLIVAVCHAIQHAHQKGIIHRDIKPSNVLVTLTDGVPVPKVIDFGIAKATGGQVRTDKTLFTALTQFIGTPAYMSPEQAKMNSLDIDTRSDIYSLGVLLYELLTGGTPFDAKELIRAGLEGMRRIIREEEPPRPSTRLSTLDAAEQTTVAKRRGVEPPRLVNLVRGDLDWIVMKCLEKDRTRRYETANALADDLERHLGNEPVVACPPSHLYRFQKLVRRNRLAFAAAAAVAASLLLGLGTVTVMFLEEREAHLQAETARQNEAGLRRQAQAAEEAARTQAEFHRLDEEALFLAGFASELGNPAATTNALDQAEKMAQTAKGLAGKLGQNHPEQGAIMFTLGTIQLARGNAQKAEALARDGLRLLPPGDHPETIAANVLLFATLMTQGRTNDAAQLLNQSLPDLVRQAIHNWQREARDPNWRMAPIRCAANLRTIDAAFHMWALDHDNAFPLNVPRAKGGTLELCSVGADGFEKNSAPHFLVISRELFRTQTLVCPGDDSKVAAERLQNLAASNITYQIRSGPEITPNSPNEILVRCPIDGNLLTCEGVVKPGDWISEDTMNAPRWKPIFGPFFGPRNAETNTLR
jgi:hypothetical protein